jgi:hypothetical protein
MDVVPIIAIIFLFGGGALVGISYSPVGSAVADRLRHGKSPLPAPEIDPAVYEELDNLRADMSELQERLDFAERLLVKPGDAEEKVP